jgi:hypothetical protein
MYDLRHYPADEPGDDTGADRDHRSKPMAARWTYLLWGAGVVLVAVFVVLHLSVTVRAWPIFTGSSRFECLGDTFVPVLFVYPGGVCDMVSGVAVSGDAVSVAFEHFERRHDDYS